MSSFSDESTSDDVVLNGEEKQEPSRVTERVIEKQQQQSTEGGKLSMEKDEEEEQEANLDDSLNVADAFGVEFMLFSNSRSYGGFRFSQECMKELNRLGLKLEDHHYLTWYDTKTRSHPIVLRLFDEMGSEWCSGPDAKLEKDVIPAGFSKWAQVNQYDEWDGPEFIQVDLYEAYEDSMDELLDRPDATVEEVRSLRGRFKDMRYGNWTNNCSEDD
jgi:hypothetical protein